MNKAILPLLVVVAFPAGAWAQEREKRVPPKMEVSAGFQPYSMRDGTGRFKIGLWTPVYVTVDAGTEGVPCDELVIETRDSEDVPTMYRVAVPKLDKKEKRTFPLTYTKPGTMGAEIKVTLQANNRTLLDSTTSHGVLDVGTHLYLTVGKRLPALQESLVDLAKNAQGRQPGFEPDFADTTPRFAGFEARAERLPDHWLGYNAVDLMILTTGDRPILDKLLAERDGARLKAIAQWVKRGGRLVISVHWNSQELVSRLLQAPAWQPPLPMVPPAVQPNIKENAVEHLLGVQKWAKANELKDRFPAAGEKPIMISLLRDAKDPRDDWEVVAKTSDGRPLIANMSYGLGRITLLAFALDDSDFASWSGNKKFFEAVFNQLAPRVSVGAHQMAQGKVWRRDGMEETDLTSQLQRTQDNFDVTVVPFGWVALFIIIYIIVVGPLDYIILKKVFKRLEWTWITFPTVVLTISALAYFTAYALKGNDLKINKVDVIDIDMRTHLDGKQQPVKAYAYGQSFFTILSPRIQNYTIGLEPTLPWWWGERKAEDDLYSADAVSWLGRPDYGSMGGRSTGLFRRPYDFALDTTTATRVIGLRGVPIPVWTTKAFTASWEAPLPQLPLKANLVYHPHQQKDLRLSGTLQNLMPVDLDDVWLFYRDRCYALKQPLTGGKAGGKERQISLEQTLDGQNLKGWAGLAPLQFQPDFGHGDRPPHMVYDPTPIVKQILFHERNDPQSTVRNHSLRPLDQSWRLREEDSGQAGDTRVREVILYGRLKRQAGSAETLSRNTDQPLPTLLWLDDLPEKMEDGKTNKSRPALAGTLVQDTYIRIIIPVRPAAE